MRDLNSLLIEGRVSGSPDPLGEDGVSFTLASVRNVDVDGDPGDLVVRLPVRYFGRYAPSYLDHLRDGDRVRVVGELRPLDDEDDHCGQSFVIKTRHIELLPRTRTRQGAAV